MVVGLVLDAARGGWQSSVVAQEGWRRSRGNEIK